MVLRTRSQAGQILLLQATREETVERKGREAFARCILFPVCSEAWGVEVWECFLFFCRLVERIKCALLCKELRDQPQDSKRLWTRVVGALQRDE